METENKTEEVSDFFMDDQHCIDRLLEEHGLYARTVAL